MVIPPPETPCGGFPLLSGVAAKPDLLFLGAWAGDRDRYHAGGDGAAWVVQQRLCKFGLTAFTKARTAVPHPPVLRAGTPSSC